MIVVRSSSLFVVCWLCVVCSLCVLCCQSVVIGDVIAARRSLSVVCCSLFTFVIRCLSCAVCCLYRAVW